ncbi:MAG TPA: adenosine kinase [Dehalococcoidia bacterium]|nr:adenosine kinase [Dehalococcoidia bacterium]
MANPEYDLVGIGNAMVDVIAHADDAFLAAQGLEKGAMTLIDAARAEHLYALMPPGIEASGGSAGNTMAAFASLGGRGAYIGKVSDDQLGQVFRHDIRAAGVAFDVPPARSGEPTGRCLIVVTDDAQRTMQTFLGAGRDLEPADVDDELIARSAVTYMEGYLWDPPGAKQAFLKAARIAHGAGRRVSISLSDPFCVERHREEFVDLVAHHVDILFANEHEIMSLYRAQTFDEALQRVRNACEVAALTRSAKGSVIVAGDELHVIDAEPMPQIVDSTGAGDAYAAGFLFGLAGGRPLAVCGRIGGVAAAEVISHVGARPAQPLRALVQHLLV